MDEILFLPARPSTENELVKSIEKNYKFIFGEDSFYFNFKRKISSTAGVISIPDAYFIFFDPDAKWGILEVELATHPLYDHIIPQITKFNRGISDSVSRRKIVENFYEFIKKDPFLELQFKEKIGSGEIYKFITDLLSSEPIIIISIDERTPELEEVIKDMKGEVRILEFKTFKREGLTENINAYLFDPITKSQIKQQEGRRSKSSGVGGTSTKGLTPGMKLTKTYKGKNFIAEVLEDQKIKIDNRTF